jgi:hypothetical protein
VDIGEASHPDGHQSPNTGERTMEASHSRQTALKHAVDDGKMGGIAAPHEELILEYYNDVHEHVIESFRSAKRVAWIGFSVLIGTLCYKFAVNLLSRFGNIGNSTSNTSLTVSEFGLLSGTLIEFIAAINFWLYARASKQFAAFHICLERTHRYLLTYLIAEQLKVNKENTLQDLVGIMANAPMITRDDLDSDKLAGSISKRSQYSPMSNEVRDLRFKQQQNACGAGVEQGQASQYQP